MAKRTQHPSPRRYAAVTAGKRSPQSRFIIDGRALQAYFGGAEQMVNLLRVYGLPTPDPKSLTRRGATANTVACLLELAHRRHTPLELYDFVVEIR